MRGKRAGDGALATSALTLSSPAPGTPNLFEFPPPQALVHPFWPVGQRYTLSPPHPRQLSSHSLLLLPASHHAPGSLAGASLVPLLLISQPWSTEPKERERWEEAGMQG